jgi:hypothetical protein
MLMHTAERLPRVQNAHPGRVRQAATRPDKVLLTFYRVSKTIFHRIVSSNISFSSAC